MENDESSVIDVMTDLFPKMIFGFSVKIFTTLRFIIKLKYY
jgi:hypothetical protein